MADPRVAAVHLSTAHDFSKDEQASITIIAGIGVKGDAHAGETVQHLSRVRADPTQPNLRQVHLIHAELFEEVAEHGFAIRPGDLGENITTRGIDLLSLGRDTVLHIGSATLRATGLRNPCQQIEDFAPGLLKHLAFRRNGKLVRKAGIMTIAETGGMICPDDAIRVETPDGPHIELDRV